MVNEDRDIYTEIACMYIRLVALYSPKAGEVLEEILATYGPHAACAGADAIDALRHDIVCAGKAPVKTLCTRFMEDYPQALQLLETAFDSYLIDFGISPA